MNKNRTEDPNIASERIDVLEKGEIFVFGSNLAGHHMGGAARAAHKKFGAEWGVGVGLTGQSYAIPTMQGGVETIRPYVNQFINFASTIPKGNPPYEHINNQCIVHVISHHLPMQKVGLLSWSCCRKLW